MLTRHSSGCLSIRQLGIVTVVAAGVCAFAAHAQDGSDWDTQAHTAVRLVAGSMSQTGAPALRAGIEIKLDPGWKTYWRDPGDSGTPPTLDFSASENVKSAAVLWPAPEKFPDEAGGHSIGYVDDVVLPLRITPQDPGRPSSLQLKLGYAICGNLCVPVQATLKLTLDGHGSGDATIEQAETRVPHRVALGARDAAGGLAVLGVHRQPGDGHDRVIVDVAAPADSPVDLFVEGPTPDWSLPLPDPVAAAQSDAGKTRRFTFDLDGLPPGAQAKGAALTFTAVSGSDAIEVTTHLD
jgi:DsbC/DsbD-like thiol-disulfide interchange protein